MDSRPHRKLDVWKKSMDFVKHVYQATETFPKSEIYGLSSQMRRAAVSIPSNLAEGAARKGKKGIQSISIYSSRFNQCDRHTNRVVFYFELFRKKFI